MVRRNKSRTLENLAGVDIQLSQDELSEIEGLFNGDTIKGGRYYDNVPSAALHLWS
jgi:pyridoxine 4-dehydrogenase